MILGIGQDIVHLPRIAALVARRGPERFAHRILSRKELDGWKPQSRDSLRYLAVRYAPYFYRRMTAFVKRRRFSVKEAAYKALYPIRPTWKELSYIGFASLYPGSKPMLTYDTAISENRDKIGRLHVSVSHDGEYVASTVIVETP